MRISTVTMFEQSVSGMNRQQGEFMKVGQQIASGRRVVNPSDDPQAASQAVGVSQSQAVNQQYKDARVSARNSLSQSENVLNSVSDAIVSAKTLLVKNSSDTLSDADRKSEASVLRSIYETLIGQANTTDGNGRYLFGGYQDDAPPFARNADDSVTYVGDDNTREQRIDASRLMAVADNGEAIFQSIPSGMGYVAIAERAVGSTGDVTFSGPARVDSTVAGYGENKYTITFTAADEFEIATIDPSGTTIATETRTYSSGGPINFGGLSMTLSGTPDVGDSVDVNPADHADANQDLFATLKRAIDALESPLDGDPGIKADLKNALSTSMRELDNSLDNVLTMRASMGARLNELDVVDAVGDNRKLNYEQTMSDLVDLDYASAISEYSLRQVGLQAAQQTFADMKGMSLFNYL
ncbi:flagellar hook-associated protein FlgL [Litchfieldella qijiaojingensis]|uniref:Flagellar hook-associated protein FlgL n=1 Tax=Litchfieldella qijiaojingensis TaxID=980347 RepID=A0ABQ2YB79_9GAMM|nr:flagellar hook-associated protein FlgL [Halomonas qijiaojingensis]GGX78026.1 flagellar hook-associated protein FlgL [Halomonas qijiaojingensis]